MADKHKRSIRTVSEQNSVDEKRPAKRSNKLTGDGVRVNSTHLKEEIGKQTVAVDSIYYEMDGIKKARMKSDEIYSLLVGPNEPLDRHITALFNYMLEVYGKDNLHEVVKCGMSNVLASKDRLLKLAVFFFSLIQESEVARCFCPEPTADQAVSGEMGDNRTYVSDKLMMSPESFRLFYEKLAVLTANFTVGKYEPKTVRKYVIRAITMYFIHMDNKPRTMGRIKSTE